MPAHTSPTRLSGQTSEPATIGSPSSGPLSFKVLTALTVAVLLTHMALLQGPPMSLGLSQSQPPLMFTLRALDPELSPTGVEPQVPELASAPPLSALPERQASARPPIKSPVRPVVPATPVEPAAAQESESPLPQLPIPNPAPAEAAAAAEAPAAEEPPPPPSPSGSRPPREVATLAAGFVVPGSVHLNYRVEANKFPYSARAELVWQQSNQTYNARLAVSAYGLTRAQTSRGQVGANGLAPVRFSDKVRSELAAHFDRDKGKVTFSANTPDVPLLTGAQDRLSILVQLASMLAANPAHYPTGTTITFQCINAKDSETWLFTMGNPETLTLPGGELATVKLVRNPRQEFDQKVELWMAPALGYMPARIRLTESNGDFIDQKWQSTEPIP